MADGDSKSIGQTVTDAACTADPRASAQALNSDCFCISLDRDALCREMKSVSGDPDFCDHYILARPHFFSGSPVFVPRSDLADMLKIAQAIEAAAKSVGYRTAALAHAHATGIRDFGPRGAFMGYDFHLAADGPKLIEINTNAGGAFLNALLAHAQLACCAEVRDALNAPAAIGFDAAVAAMFRAEWITQRGGGAPKHIAIVDDQPHEQYLYPEFILAQRLLAKQGFETSIADPSELHYKDGRLHLAGKIVDLVYNRLVDFALDRAEHGALCAAYLDGAVVVTPNPHIHALFADKRNLILLSDSAQLARWGLAPETIADLARGIPRTVAVSEANASELWASRKKLFFKPAAGYGGKAVYRGDKVTKGVWAEIIAGGYVAQDFAPPSERMMRIDAEIVSRKADFRLYTYDGAVLLRAARLYQGQTTNFRTPGGGFAPVFAV